MTQLRIFWTGLCLLRKHPNPLIRATWWGCVGLLIALCLATPALRGPLLGLWTVVNVLYVLVACAWGMFHPRPIWRTRTLCFKWAFWQTVLVTLLAYAAINTASAIDEPTGIVALFPASISAIVVLFGAPFLFGFLFTLNLTAIALVVFRERRSTDLETPARTGPVLLWTTALLALILTMQMHSLGIDTALAGVIPMGVPLFTAWFGHLARPALPDPQRAVGRLAGRIGRRLVLHWRLKGRTRIVDLRGAAIGFVTAACLVPVAGTLLKPLEMTALVAYIRLRNNLNWLQANRTVLRSDVDETGKETRADIVLLEMDEPLIHSALTTSSEAGVQAAVIRKLKAAGVRRIVLPLPYLGHDNSDEEIMTDPALLPSEQDIARTLRDTPDLAKAVREAGNVLLAVRPFHSERPGETEGGITRNNGEQSSVPASLRPLGKAAAAVAKSSLSSYESVQLPAIPIDVDGRDFPSAPLALLAADRGRPLTIRPLPGRPGFVEIAGQAAPLIASNLVLVDFRGIEPGRGFRQIPYSALLRGDRLYAGVTGESGDQKAGERQWLKPETYLKNKIVFLDSLVRGARQTPIGSMSRREVLAYATTMLLSEMFLYGADPFRAGIMAILLGIVVGHLCVRRDPLDAGWRAALPMFGVVAVSLGLFLGRNIWLDPVAPIAVSGVVFALVTQFTFALEQAERAHNRNLLRRFVAPAVIEELLNDPEAELGLGGRRQSVCVLFADVRDFTGFAEHHTPEEVIEAMNVYMTAMTDVLFAHAGILDKFTGDGLMAFFRITDPPIEGVRKAVCAAIAMRDSALSVSRQRQAEGKATLSLGMGMHFGEAIVGLVGNPEQFNYTALGHTVVVSARLQNLAQGGEIVVSDTVYSLVANALPAEAGEPVYVKGISAPVRPYRIGDLPILPSPQTAAITTE